MAKTTKEQRLKERAEQTGRVWQQEIVEERRQADRVRGR